LADHSVRMPPAPAVRPPAARAPPEEAAGEHARAHVAMAAEQDVVEHGHPAEQLNELERSRDPVRGDPVWRQALDRDVAEHDSTGSRSIKPTDAVQETPLARPV